MISPQKFKHLVSIFAMLLLSVAEILAGGKYVLVTSVDDLEVGAKVLIVNRETNVAMSIVQKTDYREPTSVEFDDVSKTSISTITANVQELELYNGYLDNTLAFCVGDNKFLHCGIYAADKVLLTKSDVQKNSSASIAIDESGIATIAFQVSHSRNVLKYNGSSKFFCDYSTDPNISLFKFVEETDDVKAIWDISFTANSCEAYIGETNAFPSLNNAQGAEVVFSSSDTNVATVDAQTGEVTLLSAGTTTISATAPETDTHVSTTVGYTLNVYEPILESGNIVFDYSNPQSLGIALPAKGQYTDINEDIVLYPVTMSVKHGTYNNTSIFQNNDGTIVTLKVYKGGSVTYSVPEGYVITKVQLTGNKLSSLGYTKVMNLDCQSVTFNSDYTQSNVPDITKATITYNKIQRDFSISSVGYATYFTDHAFIMPEGVEGGIITAVDGQTLSIDYRYAPGDVVPAETGLLLRGEQGVYRYNTTQTDLVAPAGNMLTGLLVDGETTAEGDVLYYKLANDATDGLGFYWGAADGGAFFIAANKAYLAVPKAMGARGFSLRDITTTGITNVAHRPLQKGIFDLHGRCINVTDVNLLKQGVYIVNGKKMIVR